MPLTYIGPNRPYDLPLMRNQTFSVGTAPDYCQRLFKERPHLADCFVDMSELGSALKQLRDPQSSLAQAVGKVEAETLEQRQTAARGK